jgi:prevent-host-death family protein
MAMETLSLAEAKTHFSSVLKQVRLGNEIAISFGKKKETAAVIMPYAAWKKTKKRQLGLLQRRGSVSFAPDFAVTDEDLLKT